MSPVLYRALGLQTTLLQYCHLQRDNHTHVIV